MTYTRWSGGRACRPSGSMRLQLCKNERMDEEEDDEKWLLKLTD